MADKIELNAGTKLADLLAAYPWLKEELAKVNGKFKMLSSPMGKVMLKTATISDMSKRSGMDVDSIIEKLGAMIAAHS